MSNFGTFFPEWSSRYREPPKPAVYEEDAWQTAQKITDNRLRAMRSWIEDGSKKSSGHTGYLKSNLLKLLQQLDAEALQDRYDGDRMSARIRTLIEAVKVLKLNHEGRKFVSIYELLGVPVPVTVTASGWNRRHSSAAYHMEVASDIVRDNPWM